MDNNNQPIAAKHLTDALNDNNKKLIEIIKKEVAVPIAEKFDEVNNHLEQLDTKMGKIDGDIGRLQTAYLRLDVKVEKFREKIIEKTTEDKNEILKSNDKLIKKLIKHDQEKVMLGKRVDDHEEKIEKFEPIIEKCGNYLKTLGFQPT